MSQRGMKALNSPASLPPEIAAEMKGAPILSGLTAGQLLFLLHAPAGLRVYTAALQEPAQWSLSCAAQLS